jgi:hypothetical protein
MVKIGDFCKNWKDNICFIKKSNSKNFWEVITIINIYNIDLKTNSFKDDYDYLNEKFLNEQLININECNLSKNEKEKINHLKEHVKKDIRKIKLEKLNSF